jgi:hypothetical protein
MSDNTMGDYETCSLCTTEVLDRTLIETDAGRICRDCWAESGGTAGPFGR